MPNNVEIGRKNNDKPYFAGEFRRAYPRAARESVVLESSASRNAATHG